MRPGVLAVAGLTAGLLTACGGGGSAPAPPPVRLAITAPGDRAVTRDSRIELQGTVRPAAATVTVGGRRADVADGSFRATVPLAAGTNVIDVLASAGSARPALAAIRVRREVSVRLPDLAGVLAADARRRLAGLGLKADVQEQGGIFDRLFGGDPRVCSTEPAAGEQVDPGTTVTVLASRRC